ncbi:MAG: PDZ domain-containing protein [Gemmatimonadaceae bacterium]|nr:PDZ domain-containing protein [Gemmatimonadaceae bacterium]
MLVGALVGLAGASVASAQGTTRLRIDPLSSDQPPTCDATRIMQFDASVPPAQRSAARELFRARMELAALGQALNEAVTARAGQGPVIVVRRGMLRDSLSALQVEREIGSVQRAVDSTLRRAARVRSDDNVLYISEFDTRGLDARQITMRVSGLIGQLSTGVFRESRPPAGWIGVRLIGEYLPRYTREGSAQLYCSDPIIETVEPGGPADKAGLARGDTLLTMNGQPMKGREVRFASLMEPGTTITFRARRGGRTREVPVVVEPRPARIVGIAAFDPEAPNAEGRARGAVNGFAFSFGDRPTRATERATTVAPLVSSATGGTAAFFGGARFSSLSSDLADALGVTGGVLVSSVGPGSLAAEAGLREGDVVRSANDMALTSPVQLLEQTRRARTLSLEVVRRGKSRTVELKW